MGGVCHKRKYERGLPEIGKRDPIDGELHLFRVKILHLTFYNVAAAWGGCAKFTVSSRCPPHTWLQRIL